MFGKNMIFTYLDKKNTKYDICVGIFHFKHLLINRILVKLYLFNYSTIFHWI